MISKKQIMQAVLDVKTKFKNRPIPLYMWRALVLNTVPNLQPLDYHQAEKKVNVVLRDILESFSGHRVKRGVFPSSRKRKTGAKR